MGYCTAPTFSQNSTDESLARKLRSRSITNQTCALQCKNDFTCEKNEKVSDFES